VDLIRLRFVNAWGEKWEVHYNEFLWEYFTYHGRTPNGEALTFVGKYGVDIVPLDVMLEGVDESE
jgi:hypothetical protein